MKTNPQPYDRSIPLDEDDFDSIDKLIFRTTAPHKLYIPNPGDEENFEIGIEILNQSKELKRFLLFFAAPIFEAKNHEKIPVVFGNRNAFRRPSLRDFIELSFGERIEFNQPAKLFRKDHGEAYILFLDEGGSAQYLYGPFKQGSYKVTMMYRNPYRIWGEKSHRCDFSELIEGVFKGKISSKSSEMQIIDYG